MAERGTLNEIVASEIRAWLGRRRLTGRQLAAKMGTSQTWTATRLRGEQEISINELERFADALEVSVHELLPVPVRSNNPSLPVALSSTSIGRSADARPGHVTTQLADQPRSTPINRPSEQRGGRPRISRTATTQAAYVGGQAA